MTGAEILGCQRRSSLNQVLRSSGAQTGHGKRTGLTDSMASSESDISPVSSPPVASSSIAFPPRCLPGYLHTSRKHMENCSTVYLGRPPARGLTRDALRRSQR